MKNLTGAILFAALLVLPAVGRGQIYANGAIASSPTPPPYPWSGIIPSNSGIDWSVAGVPGGIPSGSWTQSGSTITATSGDRTATIQAALNSCGTNHFVLLGSGTFNINTSVSVPSHCALRGSGANLTVLNALGGGGQAPVMLGSGSVSYSPISVTSGATAGSTSLVLASVSGVTLNQFLVLAETNDNVIVDIRGGEGNCTYCDGWTSDGHLASGQIAQVTNISGTTVSISPALYRAYPNSALVVPMTALAQYAGAEALQVYDNNTGYGQNFQMAQCAFCWVKGVEANYTEGDYVDVYWGYHDEIRDSYFSNSYTHAPGNADNDISLLYKTSATLVENNIIDRSHAAILLSWGAAGNVIGYNYCNGGFDQNSQNFVIGNIGMHGAHPQFNLLEGNVTPAIHPDQVHGSAAFNTLFRNWAEGTTLACLPLTGRGTVTCSPVGQYGGSGINGWHPFQASRTLDIDHLSTYFNIVGNVAGSAAQAALMPYGNPLSGSIASLPWATTPATCSNFTTTACRSYDDYNYNMDFGYGESSDDGSVNGVGSGQQGCDGSTNPPCHSATAFNTAFIQGNYTYANNTTTWQSGVVTIPASFYKASKPSWWGTIPYPAIGPDVTGQAGGGGHAGLIPAQNCYFNIMGGSEGGAGSPLAFTCTY